MSFRITGIGSHMKACVAVCSLFLFVITIPLSAGELRKFELPSERLAPYLARPTSPPAADAPEHEPPRSPPQHGQPESQTWRQQIQDQDQQLQRLLQDIK